MKSHKLFNILVTGGALLAAGSASADELKSEPNLAPVFCISTDACDPVHSCTAEGELAVEFVVKTGFECCWNTSCANLNESEEE